VRITEWAAQYGLAPEQIGLRAGLLVAIVFPLTLVIGLVMLRKERPAILATQPVSQSSPTGD
jgi:hypothetical protein